MQTKKKSFTIIEMIVAFSLISTALFFLFSTLKNSIFLHHKIKKEIPYLVQQEKGFFFLKNLLRKIDLKTHPIDIKKQECTFYFLPEEHLNSDNSDLLLAKCLMIESDLFLEIYKKEKQQYHLFHKHLLLENLASLVFTAEENPKTLVVTFATKNGPGYWTFFLDPYLIID